MNIACISLGCPKNQVDLDVMVHILLSAGHETVADLAEADVILVNTCGFIESAKPEAIENIDIGGPAMVRAAAKNFRDVIIITNPARYSSLIAMLLQHCDADMKTRKTLDKEAFTHTCEYDAAISAYLTKQLAEGK